MSKKPNIKNQNKLKVYLSKKDNDTKSISTKNNGTRKQSRTN